MRNGVFWLSLALVVASVALFGLSSQTRSAQAYPSDVCSVVTWDSTGKVLNDGDTIGGDGKVYLVYRLEDDSFGFLDDFIDSEEVQSLLEPTLAEIDALNAELAALVASPEWTALLQQVYGPNTTSLEILEDIADIEDEEGFNDPLDPNYEDLHDAYELLNQALQIVFTKESLEEVIREIEAIFDDLADIDLVRIDSMTGSAFVTSQAEVIGFEWVKPNVGHIVYDGALSQYVDHIFPDYFNGPDGEEIDSIRDWIAGVVGIPVPTDVSNDYDVCGTSATDGWAFVDITCREFGSFVINIIPDWFALQSEVQKASRTLVCPGVADAAAISASHTSLEVEPTPANSNKATVTVTVADQDGDRFDGAQVTFIANNCTFSNPYAGKAGDGGMSPNGGGDTIVMFSDTDSGSDTNYLINNPSQEHAGTAEATVDCSKGDPGEVVVTAIVDRPGADITLQKTIALVGPTASSGLSLTLTPDSLECGEILLATAAAVDINGVPVSDGTKVYFTTDTSSGIIGGEEGGQGSNTTLDGETTVTIAVSPTDGGVHTVIAWTLDQSGALLSQTAELFECTVVASAAPPVAPPPAGTGTNSITPPNTGDAGLAGGSGSGPGMLTLLAGFATFFAVFVGLTANRLCLYGRRR